jgi:alanyl-tRNA synthetase
MLVVANLGECEVAELRGVADQLRAQMDSYIIVLGGHSEGKCALIAQVSDDQVADGVNAGTLVRELAARVGGGGGGKPNSAQAGGKQPGKLDEALAMVEQLLDAQ